MRKSLKYAAYFTIPGVFILVFLLIFISSSFFLSRVVLPLVSRRAGVEIAASSVIWSPLRSELRGRDVRIGSAGNRCFQASALTFRYDLAELMRGRIALSDIVLKKAEFSLYRSKDGAWSCFPVPHGEKSGVTGEDIPSPEKAPLQFALRNIRLQNGTFRLFYGSGASPGVLELRDLTGTLDRFQNDAAFRLDLNGALGMEGPDLHVTSGKVSLALSGGLRPSLVPSQIAGSVGIASIQGSVNQQPIDGDSISLELDVASPEKSRLSVRKLRLRQLRGAEVRSDFELTGDLGIKPFFLHSSYDFRRVSEEVLALLCDFGFKLNPGRASLGYKGSANYENGVLAATGELHLQRSGDAFRNGERIALPDLTLNGFYDINVDLEKERARIANCVFTLTDKDKEPLSLSLLEPVDYSWNGSAAEGNARSPELELVFRDFDLKVLKFLCPPVAGFQLDSGLFSAKLHLRLTRNFSAVELLGDAVFRQLTAVRDGRRISLAELSMGVDALLQRNSDFAIRNVSISLREEKGGDLGGAFLSAQGNLKTETGSFQGRFERLTPQLAVWVAPEMAPLADLWAKFGLRELNFDFGGEVAPGMREISIGKLTAALRRGDGDFLDFRMEPVRWSSREGKLLGELRFRVNGSGDAVEFNEILRAYDVRFEAGRYRFDLNGTVAANGVNMTLRGDSAFEQVALFINRKRLDDFSFQNTFTFYRPDSTLLEVKELNFYLRRAGKPALRLECPGVLNVVNGDYRGEWSIRYLNEQFVRLWMLPPVPATQISGKMQLIGQDFFHKLRIAGGVDLNRLLPPNSEEAVSGKIQFIAEHTPELFEIKKFDSTLQRAGESLFDFVGSCRIDRVNRNYPIRIQMLFESLALDRLAALWTELTGSGDPSPSWPEEEVAAAPPPPPRLYAGSRPVDMDFRLNNVRITPELQGNLTTRIQAGNGSVRSDYLELRLNRSLYRGEFRANNQVDGIRYDLEMKGADPLSLKAVLNPFLPGSQEDLGGYLKRLDLALSWLDRGRPGSAASSLTGHLGMEFADLVIPNTVTRGTFGGLLLAPLEMLAGMDGLLPREISELRQKLLNDRSLHRKLKTIRFSRGDVQLNAIDGNVTVDECRFVGDWIKRLLFTGTFQLAGEQRLELESQISAGGVNLTVPVSGTLGAPEVTFASAAANNVSAFVEKLKEFHLIGTAPSGEHPGEEEPVIVIDELPTAGTIREIEKMFKDIWKKQDDGN